MYQRTNAVRQRSIEVSVGIICAGTAKSSGGTV